MDGAIAPQIEGATIEALVAVLLLCLARPFGLLFGFYPFAWAFGHAVLLRISIAIALAMPVIAAQSGVLIDILRDAGALIFVTLVVIEFALGFGLAIIASLPLKALEAAGAITDQFRGEFEGAIIGPGGTTLHTSSMLYLAIGMFVFFAMGGLWFLIGGLYETYALWPVGQTLPDFQPFAASFSLNLLDTLMMSAVLIAAPLLLLMVGLDFTLAVAARLARRYGLYDLSFPTKNLAMLIALPIIAMALIQISEDLVFEVRDLPELFERLFQ